ncbi:MAG TPA: sarcosine oxidase subunit alpha family protein [Geminicoccaceae bacterium]|nr:sarcosine oxidase subunit alpha family protein [Geminicoccaceae bacterium]
MSPDAFRLRTGGRIDRTSRLAFTFDGRRYKGLAGDTLASALLANGVKLFGRSFKHHRRRGIMGFGVEEPNALVTIGNGAAAEPNTRATMVELAEGLEATSQNRWPTLSLDLQAVNGLAGRFLGAGFYYKTFKWPPAAWTGLYEKVIRHAAGLGRASHAADPDRYDKSFAFCDVLVVGGGPAGLMAALVAGRAGARVTLADEMPALGGRLRHEDRRIDGRGAMLWLGEIERELAALANVTLLRRTTVFGAYDHGTFGAVEQLASDDGRLPRQRFWQISAGAAVLATGAIERSIAFAGNDLPGVMLASAAQGYLFEHAVVAGWRPVVFTTNSSGYATALDLVRAGIAVQAVIDNGPVVDSATARALHEAGVPLFRHAVVERAVGGRAVTGVVMRDELGGRRELECDQLLVSGGWNPTLHLAAHRGGRPRWDDQLATFLPPPADGELLPVGAAAGRFALEDCLADGAMAAVDLCRRLGHAARTPTLPGTDEAEAYRITPFFAVEGTETTAFVDLQNDVTVADLRQAAAEGYRSIEHAKRYTTLGMATDQGKTANVTGLAILAEALARPVAEVGTTGFRPPYTPVAIGALAHHHRGPHFAPVRRTPLHAAQVVLGAVFFETGLWLRARYVPRPGEDMAAASRREVQAVRAGVGVVDVSPLGKIELAGSDARAFLERLYCNGMATLRPGRARYGLMLREDGMVLDDGTIWCFGSGHFMVTTTTANAAAVLSHMELHHQHFWPELDVQFASVSEQWAGLAVAGPRSREVLQRVVDEPALDDASFPFMAVAEGRIGGVVCRIARISFSGERAFEVFVPAGHAEALLDCLLEAGATDGITLYGLEAMGTMRIEKGHVAGAELDGRTTPRDLGLERMQIRKKPHIGAALRDRPGLTDPARPMLVGLVPVDRSERLRAGALLVPEGAEVVQANDLGRVTSIAWSPGLGHPIALGFLAHGTERLGQRVDAVFPLYRERVTVEVRQSCFVDPEGERLRG